MGLASLAKGSTKSACTEGRSQAQSRLPGKFAGAVSFFVVFSLRGISKSMDDNKISGAVEGNTSLSFVSGASRLEQKITAIIADNRVHDREAMLVEAVEEFLAEGGISGTFGQILVSFSRPGATTAPRIGL